MNLTRFKSGFLRCAALAVLWCGVFARPAVAQVSYGTSGSVYVQNFNAGLPAASNNSATWTDNSTYPGWYVYRAGAGGAPATYRINSVSGSGEVQLFRSSASSTDGALGARPTDAIGDVHYGLRLTNATGGTLTGFTLGFSGEQWYNSNSGVLNQLKVSYQLGSPANLVGGTWTDVPRLVFSSPNPTGTVGDLTGSNAANRAMLDLVTVRNLSWPAGTDIWIRFTDDNSSGVDHGLAIDDVTFSAFGNSTYAVNSTYFGASGGVEYHAGDLPLIVTAPHGGTDKPATIADRVNGSTGADTNTQDLARRISDEIFLRTGRYPHLVIGLFARSKVDFNRRLDNVADTTDQALDAGANGPPLAAAAWREYHTLINAIKAKVVQTAPNFGFLTDIHGQDHAERLELGYNLSRTNLSQTDAALEHPAYGERSTYRTLSQDLLGSFADLVRGPRSMGGLLAQRGYVGSPTPANPDPGPGEFLDGGYTVEVHTSLTDQGDVQGMQIESQKTGVRDTAANRAAFAKAIVSSLNDFLFDRFGYELGAGPIYRLTASAPRFYEGGSGASSVVLTITRTGYVPTTAAADTLALDFSGTATLGADYTASATSVTFAATETVKTITLTRVADGLVEGAESVIVKLAPTGVQTVSKQPVTVVLSDDEIVSVDAVALNPVATEGGASAAVKISRDSVTSSALQATLAFSGTAVRGVDYNVTGMDTPSGSTLTIAADAADQTIQIVPAGNAVLDPQKSVIVSVVDGGASYKAGVLGTATVVLAEEAGDRPTGLQLWLPGTTGTGIVRDESGFDRHGVIRPGTDGHGPTAATGHAPDTTAVYFDGTEDALVLPNFNFTSGGAFSVAFGFRVDSSTTDKTRYLVNLGPDSRSHTLNIFHVEGSNILRTLLKDGSPILAPSDTALDLTGIANTGSGGWHHYVLTASPAGGVKVYLDGVLKKSVASWSGRFVPSEPLWLGWKAEGESGGIPTRTFQGPIEGVRLYSRELTAGEVTALATPFGPPALTGPATAAGTYGSAFAYAITATNFPTTFGATGLPAGLTVDPATGAITGAPEATGTFTVTLSATNFAGTVSAPLTLTVAKAAAPLSLGGLTVAYDGTGKSPTPTTTPASLGVTYTYNGSATPPITPGTYTVVATINDANYTGTATGTLVIAPTAVVRHAPTLSGGLDGSVQVLLPESVSLATTAWLSGDLLIPGAPTVVLSGTPTYAGTTDGLGAASPSSHTVTLNGSAVLRHVVRRTDAGALPTIAAPPTPAGTRNVALTAVGQSAGDFATLRNLTLAANAGPVSIPPGTYGTFSASGNSALVLGVPGATEPAVYNLQALSLNVLAGTAQIQVVGPVILTVANSVSLFGTTGAVAHPEWLTLRVATGGITINGTGVAVHGNLIAPNGTVTLNGTSTLNGTVAADRLTINASAVLNDPGL